ncbi:MAG TPA: class I SAM-dependent methyltransferase [Streptosporangiaceae bacterium]|nr:class I SAM-dependent methyltransferase [Streptosporangiaceae bacterium]
MDAERYERARPSYPQALIERILAVSPGPDVLDIGCGTGISSRPFTAAGCRVLGVEPDERMADLARRGGLEVEVAKFEDWDPAGRAFDAAVAGQAWHWVDPVAGAARAAQALRPGGRLVVFWNAFQPPPALSRAFADVYDAVLPGFPGNLWSRPIIDGYRTMCGTAADGMRQAGAFGECEQWQFDWERPYTRDEWLDAVPTFGGHSRLPAQAQRELLAGLGAAVDAVGGSFTMGYATVAATAARTGGS